MTDSWEKRFPNPHTRPDRDHPYTKRMRAAAKLVLGFDALEDEINIPEYLEQLQRQHATPEYQERVAELDREQQELAEVQRDREYRRMLERLSPLHVRAVLAGCDAELRPTSTTEIQRKVAAEWGGVESMFLLGNTGIGKTYTATWCAMRAAARGHDVASVTASRVAALSFDGLLILRQVRLLVLDQLHTLRSPAGKELPAWQVTPVVDLIDYRYEHELTTIAAGTIAPEDMVDLLGADVKRRFPFRRASESTETRKVLNGR